MKKIVSVVMLLAVMVVSTFMVVKTASAEEIKMIGVATKIVMSADQKSATVTLKDNKSGADVIITVTDDTTLDKFKDHRIVEGDEIRCKYNKQGDKNVARIFKKTAGC